MEALLHKSGQAPYLRHEQAKAAVSDTELASVQRGVGGAWVVDGVV